MYVCISSFSTFSTPTPTLTTLPPPTPPPRPRPPPPPLLSPATPPSCSHPPLILLTLSPPFPCYLSKAKRDPVAVALALANITRAAGKMKKANIAANKGGSPYAQSTTPGTHSILIYRVIYICTDMHISTYIHAHDFRDVRRVYHLQ